MREAKKIQVNGATLAYYEYGSGDKYVICSQNFFVEEHYAALLGMPPYDYHVFLLVMRGYGESDHIMDTEPRDYTKIWSEDVIAFAKAMGINRFFYTGHSHGNYPGWYMCFHAPELLRGFVSCDGILQFHVPHTGGTPSKAPGFDIKDLLGNTEALKKMAFREEDPTDNPERLARRARLREESTANWLSKKPEEFTINNSNFAVTEAQSEEELMAMAEQIRVPILLINGGMDKVATIEEVVSVAKHLHGCKLVMYQNMGHSGLHECPDLIAQDMDQFFRAFDGRIL